MSSPPQENQQPNTTEDHPDRGRGSTREEGELGGGNWIGFQYPWFPCRSHKRFRASRWFPAFTAPPLSLMEDCFFSSAGDEGGRSGRQASLQEGQMKPRKMSVEEKQTFIS